MRSPFEDDFVKRNLVLLFCAVSAVMLSLAVAAQGRESLAYFQAAVPVTSQSAENRKYAAQKGMQQVLVRMSASESVLLNETIKGAVTRAQSYIQQFQFRPVTDPELLERGYREEMFMAFSPKLIQGLMRDQARVPYWAAENRPKILVWLVEDEPDYGRQLLNQSSVNAEGEAHPAILALQASAKERGLPLAFPLLDLEDQMAISSDEVWYMEEEKIREASQRYTAPVILVGRYSYTSQGELWSTWQYFHQDFNQTWDSRTSELDKFAWEGLAPLNQFLAGRYAIVPGAFIEDTALIVRLQNVDSFKRFRAAMDYLAGLALISEVKIIQASSNELLLALNSEASIERFKSTVQLDRKIQFIPQQSDLPEWQRPQEGTRENPIVSTWLGS